MNTKHTPAPWNYVHVSRMEEFEIYGDVPDGKRWEPRLCKIQYNSANGIDYETTEANAKLIAAAPELLEEETKNLEFLKWVATKAREFNMWSDKVQELYERISKTEAAIKKATE